jgi:hypothetical protein
MLDNRDRNRIPWDLLPTPPKPKVTLGDTAPKNFPKSVPVEALFPEPVNPPDPKEPGACWACLDPNALTDDPLMAESQPDKYLCVSRDGDEYDIVIRFTKKLEIKPLPDGAIRVRKITDARRH